MCANRETADCQRRKRMEEASKEARRRELKAANDALHKRATGPAPVVSTAYDPFAEDQRAGPSSVSSMCGECCMQR